MFINVFCNSHIRKLVLSQASPEVKGDYSKAEAKARVKVFIQKLMQYFDDDPDYINKVICSDKSIHMESLILFYMVLLTEYNTEYNNTLTGNDVVIKAYNIKKYANIFFTTSFNDLFGISPLVEAAQAGSTVSNPPFVVKFQDEGVHELFYQVGNQQYTLTSISIVNYKINLMMNHAIGLYESNGRFYTWESNLIDMNFLEHTILNLDLDQIEFWKQHRLFFNAAKGQRICIYTPTLPILSPTEVGYLRDIALYLYEKKTNKTHWSLNFKCFRPNKTHPEPQSTPSVIRCIAILIYFTRFIFITVKQDDNTLNKYLFISKYKDSKHELSIISHNSLEAEKLDLKNPTDVDFIDDLVKKLTTINNNDVITHILAFRCRFVISEKTVDNILNVISKYLEDKPQEKQKGGQKHRYIIMKKSKKVYKVRKNKAGQSYILMNKNKVLLSDMKGRYVFRRD
jgi:hypothetical protein